MWPSRNPFTCCARMQTEPRLGCLSTTRKWFKARTRSKICNCKRATRSWFREAGMSHRVAIFLILLAGLLPTLRAQEPAPAFGQDLGKSSSEPEAFVPTPLGTETGSLAFTTELARSNYLDGGLSVGTTFDDNFLMSNTDRISNW